MGSTGFDDVEIAQSEVLSDMDRSALPALADAPRDYQKNRKYVA
jgi:hypothetical protein